jgi:hypothetical protein
MISDVTEEAKIFPLRNIIATQNYAQSAKAPVKSNV